MCPRLYQPWAHLQIERHSYMFVHEAIITTVSFCMGNYLCGRGNGSSIACTSIRSPWKAPICACIATRTLEGGKASISALIRAHHSCAVDKGGVVPSTRGVMCPLAAQSGAARPCRPPPGGCFLPGLACALNFTSVSSIVPVSDFRGGRCAHLLVYVRVNRHMY
jgi:hypothetical protein